MGPETKAPWCANGQFPPSLALEDTSGPPRPGGYAGVRLGEAQNPRPAEYRRGRTPEPKARTRINEAGDAVPGSHDSILRGARHLQLADAAQRVPAARAPPTMLNSHRPTQQRPRQQKNIPAVRRRRARIHRNTDKTLTPESVAQLRQLVRAARVVCGHIRSRRGNRCNHCRADTATRDLVIGTCPRVSHSPLSPPSSLPSRLHHPPTHRPPPPQSFQLILCALLVAPLRETQMVAMFMCDHAGAASRSSARRRRERPMRPALRHEHLSIAMHFAQALHHNSGPRQHEKLVEGGEEVEVTKLPQGVRPEALVSASEPHVLVLRAGLVVSQMAENVVAVPKIDSGGLLLGGKEILGSRCVPRDGRDQVQFGGFVPAVSFVIAREFFNFSVGALGHGSVFVGFIAGCRKRVRYLPFGSGVVGAGGLASPCPFLVAENVAGILVTVLGFGGPGRRGLVSPGPHLGAKSRLSTSSSCLWVSSLSELCLFFRLDGSHSCVFFQQCRSQVLWSRAVCYVALFAPLGLGLVCRSLAVLPPCVVCPVSPSFGLVFVVSFRARFVRAT